MPQKFLSIKNFEKYQTYKHSNPPWFKIHKSLFGDPEFIKLSPPYRFLYIGLIYLAVETNNKIYNDSQFLIQRLYLSRTDLVHLAYTPRTQPVHDADTTRTDGVHNPYTERTQLNLTPLYRAGFLVTSNLRRTLSVQSSYSTVQDSTVQSNSVVVDDLYFDPFWVKYPKKVGKEVARKAWTKIRPDLALFHRILAALDVQKQSPQWLKDGGQFIPNPATWLNQKRWEDELVSVPHIPKSMVDLL